MPKKKTSVPHCPNCGAPINLYASTSSTVKCEYCDSFVNVADFRPSAPPAPSASRQEPSPPPKPVYKPTTQTPPNKEPDIGMGIMFVILKYTFAAFILFCVIPTLLRGCFPHI